MKMSELHPLNVYLFTLIHVFMSFCLQTQNKVLDINCKNEDGYTPLMLATRDMLTFERLSTQMSRPYNPVEVVSELLSARG